MSDQRFAKFDRTLLLVLGCLSGLAAVWLSVAVLSFVFYCIGLRHPLGTSEGAYAIYSAFMYFRDSIAMGRDFAPILLYAFLGYKAAQASYSSFRKARRVEGSTGR
jgi:membrane associated rhomboid family serine protease